MKRILCVVLLCVCLAGIGRASAADVALLGLRDKLFEESKKMNLALADSGDPVMIISLWDTCVVTVTKINAYFYMLGIFETVKEKDQSSRAIDYLLIWLNETKRTNMAAIEQLGQPAQVNEEATDGYRAVIAGYLSQLDTQLEQEIRKVTLLKRAMGTEVPK